MGCKSRAGPFQEPEMTRVDLMKIFRNKQKDEQKYYLQQTYEMDTNVIFIQHKKKNCLLHMKTVISQKVDAQCLRSKPSTSP